MSGSPEDIGFMRRALVLAESQLGNVSPNPSVGCVIVKDGKIIAEGVTQSPGGKHAEIVALGKCDAYGATLYTTLEPCCHMHKRTPPCTDAIVAAGIKRVVIGILDPNPEVSGRGVKILQSTHIDVTVGVCGEDAAYAHEFFTRWITEKIPFVTLKVAVTFDGKLTWGDGKNKQIIANPAMRRVHVMRAKYDALMVGVTTVLLDNPRLTCRLADGKHPVRVILDSRLRIPVTAQLLKEPGKTIVFTTDAHDVEKRRELQTICDVVIVETKNNYCDISEVLACLGEMNITSVLVEGGRTLTGVVLNESYAQKLVVFTAPFFRPDGSAAFEFVKRPITLATVRSEQIGDDIVTEGYF